MAAVLRPRPPPGGPPSADKVDGRASTPQWKNQSMSKINQAEISVNQSTTLRNQSHLQKAQIEKQTKDSSLEVNNLLREKVTETLGIKNKLEKTISELMTDMGALTNTKKMTQTALEDLRGPTLICEKRVAIRHQRPKAESINDTVERSLNAEHGTLKQSANTLTVAVGQAEKLLEQMQICRRQLISDLDDKTVSVKLDQDCLNVKYDADGSAKANMVSQVALNIQPKKSRKMPEKWRGDTSKLMERSETLREDSRNLCKSLKKLITQVTTNIAKLANDTNNGLKAKVKQTTRLQAELSKRQSELNQELLALQGQRSTVQSALQNNQAPLSVHKQRLAIRRNRPSRESVRDKVEECMEAELAKLNHAIMEFEKQIKTIDGEMSSLKDTKRQVEQDLAEKNEALRLDKHCLELDVDVYSVASVGTLPSIRTSSSYSRRSGTSSARV